MWPRTNLGAAMARAWIGTAMALLVVTVGCGKSSQSSTATDTAKARVVAVVNATAAKVAPGLHRVEDKGGAPYTGCDTATGAPATTAIADFGYVIDLQADTDVVAM